jgi:hypothetical protein
MGMACWTTCEDCDEKAPELGDHGYMGYPSLDDEVPDVDVATFGSIYRALVAVHVVTGEVDAFYRFLERHKGHRVVTETEGGSPFEDDDDMEDMDELYDDEDFDDEDDADYEDDFDDEDMEEDFDEAADSPNGDSYAMARYKATCPHCNASFVTEYSESFVPFDRATLTAKDMKMFQQRVVEVMDEASYHAEPLYGDDLDNLARFFKDHMKHEVVVELVAEKE